MIESRGTTHAWNVRYEPDVRTAQVCCAACSIFKVSLHQIKIRHSTVCRVRIWQGTTKVKVAQEIGYSRSPRLLSKDFSWILDVRIDPVSLTQENDWPNTIFVDKIHKMKGKLIWRSGYLVKERASARSERGHGVAKFLGNWPWHNIGRHKSFQLILLPSKQS